MICRKCGQDVPSTTETCPNCGAHVDPVFGGLVEFFSKSAPGPKRNYWALWGFGFGIATFMFGIVYGLNLIALFTGPHGLVFSILGLVGKNLVPSKRRAITGLICSILGLIASAINCYFIFR